MQLSAAAQVGKSFSHRVSALSLKLVSKSRDRSEDWCGNCKCRMKTILFVFGFGISYACRYIACRPLHRDSADKLQQK